MILGTELREEGGEEETVTSNKSQQISWNASLSGSFEILALHVLNTTKKKVNDGWFCFETVYKVKKTDGNSLSSSTSLSKTLLSFLSNIGCISKFSFYAKFKFNV